MSQSVFDEDKVDGEEGKKLFQRGIGKELDCLGGEGEGERAGGNTALYRGDEVNGVGNQLGMLENQV